MEHDSVIVDRLSQMGFRVYSDAEILRLSVKEVTNPQLFDNLQLPTIGGLYDPALGRFTWLNTSLPFCGNCCTVPYIKVYIDLLWLMRAVLTSCSTTSLPSQGCFSPQKKLNSSHFFFLTHFHSKCSVCVFVCLM